MEPNVWEIAGVIVRALTYAATFGAAGGAFFLVYDDALISDLERLQTRRLIGMMIVVSVCGSLLRIPLTAGSMSGELGGLLDPGLNAMVWQAGEGRAITIRIAGLILESAALLLLRGPALVASLGAAVAASSFAWIGHPHALRPNALAELLVGVHLLGVAFWLGALPPLLMVTRNPDPLRIARPAQRFGRAALLVVALLAAAGAGLLSMLLGTIAELWTSPYGRAITLKIGLVAGLLGAAAVNKLRLTPRLASGDLRASSSLRRSIWVEICLSSAILITTATLTTILSPASL